MLPLGLCVRTNVRQGKRLFRSSIRWYNTTTSKSPYSTKHSQLYAACWSYFNSDFVFYCYRFSTGLIFKNRYWNKWKVLEIVRLFILYFYTFEFYIYFPDVEPIVFSFRVKFFPADPFRLTGNSKILIYQQLKRDLIHGRLYCSAGEAAALGSLIVQGRNLLNFK